MIPAVVSVVVLVCLTLTYKVLNLKGYKFLPPGPKGLPIIGYLHKLGSQPLHLIMYELSKKYGDIFSIQLGSRLTVVLNSKEAIYEAFIKKAKIFAGRPDLATFNKTRHGATGISMCDFTEDYKKNKQMTLKVLHKLYSNKQQFNDILRHEASKMVDLFNTYASNEKVFDPALDFHKVSPSAMVHVMFGKNFSYDQPDIVSLVQCNRRWFESAEASNPADFITILEKFPNKRLDAIEQSGMAFYNFVLNKMGEYEHEECSGLFGSYISLYKEHIGEGKSFGEREKFELARVVADLLGGGFDTLAGTMSWALLHLYSSPDVVAKCRQEMKDVVGENDVTIDDESSLPYTMAMIYDLLRFVTTAPLALPRKTMEEVRLKDYIIPKDTMVFGNLWAVNNNDKLWKKPDQLHPENFLTEQGELNVKSIRNAVSFSSGVRRCPGEKFALLQLLLLITSFIKNYDIEMIKPPQDMIPQGGLTLQPKPYKIKLLKV